MVGSFLSTHLMLTGETRGLGDLHMPGYEGELLGMAHDLATRLLPAFEGTATGLPYPRVNLKHGILPGTINETCTSGEWFFCGVAFRFRLESEMKQGISPTMHCVFPVYCCKNCVWFQIFGKHELIC